MSSYGPLTASNPTTFNFTGFCPEAILVDTVDASLVIDSLSVTVAGEQKQEVDDQQVIQAMSSIAMAGLLGASVKQGQLIKIANGQVDIGEGQQCRVVLGNAGATTPTVYAFSTAKGNRAYESNQDSINARANQKIQDVDFLLFEDTNFSKATINYRDGHVESDLSLVEIAAMNAAVNPVADADGKVSGVNCVSFNRLDNESVVLFAGTGGALPYYYLNL